jgi:hypothetical protein
VKVPGYEALQIVEFPNSDGVLVVTDDHDFRGTWPNRFRVAADGAERWAAAPGGADAFTHVDIEDKVVIGATHYGRTRRLDLVSGQLVT